MKRALVFGFGVALGSSAVAQPPALTPAPTPVSVYPGTTVRSTPETPPPVTPTPPTLPTQAGRTDPLQPLGGLLAMPLPTAPTVPAGVCVTGACAPACGTPLYSTACRDGAGKSRPCLDRVVTWLTWHSGPSLLPVRTPTPYRTPLQAYFACAPLKNPGYPAAATCSSPTPSAAPSVAPGVLGGRLASAFGLGGVTTSPTRDVAKAQPPVSTAATPRQATPQASRSVPANEIVIPLPAFSDEVSVNFSGRCALDRLLAQFSRGPGTTDSAVVPAGYSPTR